MKAPKYVIAPPGCAEYLTPGRPYEVRDWNPNVHFLAFFNFIDDNGALRPSRAKDSRHLSGGDWIIPDEAKSEAVEPVKTLRDEPAFACAAENGHQPGMSIRAYAAIEALNGLLAGRAFTDSKTLAEYAVAHADALLAELAARKEKGE
ncbi:MAG: hypothetical protein KF895_03205 [Parvibaculum sp.]|nr:hypothetical protein [Parvibaculum sp.]